MRVTESQLENVVLSGSALTYTDELHLLFVACRAANHHIVNERAVETVERTMLFVIRFAFESDLTVLDLDRYGLINLLGELSLGSFDGADTVFELDIYAGGYLHREFTNSRHVIPCD